MSVQERQLVPGLAGVPAAESAISFIDGQAGLLAYRGHRIETLAEESGFEETAWLLMHGALPARAELEGFRGELAARRALPPELAELIPRLPRGGHPMGALQATVPILGMVAGERDWTVPENRVEAAHRILAAVPTLVAAFHRARGGQPIVAPDPELDTAANFLWMLSGERPDDLSSRVLDVALVLHADHTMNASTFAARVVASTEAGPYDLVSAAVGALHGALHGGANERVLRMLESIGSVDAVEAFVEERLRSKGKVMGFGHRVYKVKDPRSTALQSLVKDLFATHGSTPMYDVALRLEEEVVKRLGGKGIHPNVDFFSGLVYQKLGIPTDVFTPVFAIARTAGWLAHWLEQMEENRLFRPAQIYVGAHGAEWVPIDERG